MEIPTTANLEWVDEWLPEQTHLPSQVQELLWKQVEMSHEIKRLKGKIEKKLAITDTLQSKIRRKADYIADVRKYGERQNENNYRRALQEDSVGALDASLETKVNRIRDLVKETIERHPEVRRVRRNLAHFEKEAKRMERKARRTTLNCCISTASRTCDAWGRVALFVYRTVAVVLEAIKSPVLEPEEYRGVVGIE